MAWPSWVARMASSSGSERATPPGGPLLEPYGDEARLAQVLVLLEGGALDEAPLGGEDQVAFLVQAPHGEEGRHLLVLGEGRRLFTWTPRAWRPISGSS